MEIKGKELVNGELTVKDMGEWIGEQCKPTKMIQGIHRSYTEQDLIEAFRQIHEQKTK